MILLKKKLVFIVLFLFANVAFSQVHLNSTEVFDSIVNVLFKSSLWDADSGSQSNPDTVIIGYEDQVDSGNFQEPFRYTFPYSFYGRSMIEDYKILHGDTSLLFNSRNKIISFPAICCYGLHKAGVDFEYYRLNINDIAEINILPSDLTEDGAVVTFKSSKYNWIFEYGWSGKASPFIVFQFEELNIYFSSARDAVDLLALIALL